MKKIENQLISDYTEKNLVGLEEVRSLLNNNLKLMSSKWRTHLPLFLGPSEIARVLWLNDLLQKVIEVPGVIVEFGSQFGASLSTLINLVQIHDTWNASRKIYSFSTFEDGFVNVVTNKDGLLVENGDYAVPNGWCKTLETILGVNSKNSPIGNQFQVIEGDATITFPRFMRENPGTIISMVHFDMDIYKPTKDTLIECLNYVPKGGILVFDELNHPGFPGETMAVDEVLGIRNLKLRKSKYQPYSAYVIIE